MNPNPDIWGSPESWLYSPHTTYGLTSQLAQTLNADRPKIANFGTGTTADYEGSLLRAIKVSQKMVLNEYVDETVCPCGQDAKVSPFAKVAIFNENDDLSTTPRVVTIADTINWFFADRAASTPDNSAFTYMKQYTRSGSTGEGLKFQQFAPKANSPANSTNVDMQLCPYTYYGLRSLFLSVEVHCMSKTAANPVLNTNWRTLRAWETQYAETEDIIGLRLYVRTCQAIDSTTHALTYSNDKAISHGQQSFLCITNPYDIVNDGAVTPTQLLSRFNRGQRSIYIFDITDTIYAWDHGADGRTNRAILPCWDYFDEQTVHTWYGNMSDPERYYFYKIPFTESNHSKIMSIAALFGCFFTDRNVYSFDYDMLSEYVYLPIIDSDGIAHGQYTNGADNVNNPLYSKKSIRDMNYDPYAKHYGTYCKVCGYGGEYKSICPRCHATGDNLLNIPAMTQGPIWRINPDDPEYGDLYTIDVERDSDNGTHYTNPNLHRRVSDVVIDDDYMPYFHLEGTHEEIEYPDSEPCSVSNFKFGTDETTEKPTIQQYTGSQQNIQIPSMFVNAGYTTLGKGLFTDTDVVYVEIPEGITTIE